MEPWKKVTRGALWQQRVCGPYLFLKQSKQQKKQGCGFRRQHLLFLLCIFSYFAKISSICFCTLAMVFSLSRPPTMTSPTILPSMSMRTEVGKVITESASLPASLTGIEIDVLIGCTLLFHNFLCGSNGILVFIQSFHVDADNGTALFL